MHMDVFNTDRTNMSFCPAYLHAQDALIPKICKHCNNFMEIKQINLTEAVRQCYKCSASSQCVDISDIEFFHRSYRDIDKSPKDWGSYSGTEEDELSHLQSWIEHFQIIVSKYEDSSDDEAPSQTNFNIRNTSDELPSATINDIKINELVDSLGNSEMCAHEIDSEWNYSVIDELDAALEKISNEKSNLRDLPFSFEDLFPPQQDNIDHKFPSAENDFPHSDEARTARQDIEVRHSDFDIVDRTANILQGPDIDQGSESPQGSDLVLCDVTGDIVEKTPKTVNQDPSEASYSVFVPEKLISDNSQITDLDKISGKSDEYTHFTNDVPEIIAEEIIESKVWEQNEAVSPAAETRQEMNEIRASWNLESSLRNVKSYAPSLKQQKEKKHLCEKDKAFSNLKIAGLLQSGEKENLTHVENSQKEVATELSELLFETTSVVGTPSNSMYSEPRDEPVATDCNETSHCLTDKMASKKQNFISVNSLALQSSVNLRCEQICVCDDSLNQLPPPSDSEKIKFPNLSHLSLKEQQVEEGEEDLGQHYRCSSDLDKVIFSPLPLKGTASSHMMKSQHNSETKSAGLISETPTEISINTSVCSFPDNGLPNGIVITVPASEDITSEMLALVSKDDIPIDFDCAAMETMSDLSSSTSDKDLNPVCSNISVSSPEQQSLLAPSPCASQSELHLCSSASVSSNKDKKGRTSLFDIKCSEYNMIQVDIDTYHLCVPDESSVLCPPLSTIKNGDRMEAEGILLHDSANQHTVNHTPYVPNNSGQSELPSIQASEDSSDPSDGNFHYQQANLREDPQCETLDDSWLVDSTNMPDDRDFVVGHLVTRNITDVHSASSPVKRWDNYSESKRYQDLKNSVTETFDELESFAGAKFKPMCKRKKKEVSILGTDSRCENLFKVMQREVELSSAQMAGKLLEDTW